MSVLEGKIPGAGVTIPEVGIVVRNGTYVSYKNGGIWEKALLQHEYGHILQYRLVGQKAYYGVIAPLSLGSAIFNSSHNTFWIETWANHLSKGYFGSNWNNFGGYFGAQNISPFNLLMLLRLR